MAKMQDSGIEWLGEIPAHWEVIKLFVLFQEHKCKNFGLQEKNLLSLSYGKIIRKDINTSEGLLPTSFENYNIIEKGYIVFRLTDLQNDKHSLRTGLCKERGIITSAYVTLKLKSEDLPEYMHYLFHAYDVCKVFYGMGDGVRQGMSYSDLKKLWIIRPPIAEQEKIAEFLDKKCSAIDSAVDAAKKLVEKLREYKKSLITETVTKGLNPSAEMREINIEWIGEIPTHWKIYRLKFCLKESLQYGANSSGVEFDENLPRYIRITDIISFTTLKDTGKLSLNFAEATPYLLEDGDILLARSGATVGKTFIYSSKMGQATFAGYLIRAKVNCKKLLAKFFSFFTQCYSYDEWKNQIFIQATIQNIGAERYNNLKFPLPPIEEQKEIADFLDKKCAAIDENISKREKLIEKLSEYKKSLIYEVVTGKVEV